MFWFSTALASGVMGEPQVRWVDEACETVDPASHPANADLRLVWVRYGATSPPGGPVTRHVQTLEPARLRLREQGCAPEPEPWEGTDQVCDGVEVLRWTGTLRSGESWVVEHDGRSVATVKTHGPAHPGCMRKSVQTSSTDRMSPRVERSVTLPAFAVTVDAERAWVEVSIQDALAGTVPYMRPPYFRPVVSRPGTPERGPDGEVSAVWTEQRHIVATSGPGERGEAQCTVSTYTDASLAIPGVQGVFTQQGVTGSTVTRGRCGPGAGSELLTDDAITADLERRIASLRPPVVPERPAYRAAQSTELAAVQASAAFVADPVAALEGLVRRWGWEEPEGFAAMAGALRDAGRYDEAAFYAERALHALPSEPSPARARVLRLVATCASEGLPNVEPSKQWTLFRQGYGAVRELEALLPEDAEIAALQASLDAWRATAGTPR